MRNPLAMHRIDKTKGLVCFKMGVFKAFYYGDILIGCSTPEGDFKLLVKEWEFNATERKAIAARMDQCNLNAGWIAGIPMHELVEKVYRGWLLNFAAHARERMQGDESIA